MSIRGRILTPVGRIRSDRLRRIALVAYGAPVAVLVQALQLLLAPLAILLILVIELLVAMKEAVSETAACAWASTVAEPKRWSSLWLILKRVWQIDIETWASREIAKREPRQ